MYVGSHNVWNLLKMSGISQNYREVYNISVRIQVEQVQVEKAAVCDSEW